MPLPRQPAGSTGASVSPLGIGALAVGDDPERVVRSTTRLLDAGCNLIDTAACYPGHEELIGRHLSQRRDDYLLISKCGHHDKLPDGRLRSRPIAIADVDAALRRLRTDHLDGMLLHSYDLEPLQAGDALAVLARAREQGKIRWVGYAGDNAAAAWAAEQELVQVIECSCSIADQHNIDQLVPICRRRGVLVIAKKPIANASWRYIGRRDEAHPANRAYVDRLAALDLRPEDYGCSDMAELALRFTLAIDGLHCAIVSASDPAHQDANLAAVERGPLAEAAVAELRRRFAASSQGQWLGCN